MIHEMNIMIKNIMFSDRRFYWMYFSEYFSADKFGNQFISRNCKEGNFFVGLRVSL